MRNRSLLMEFHKRQRPIRLGLLLLMAAPWGGRTEEDPVPPTNRPSREVLRERAAALSPEDRQRMIREFREKHGPGVTNRAEFEKRREEWKQLPPAEREAKIREFRENLGTSRREFRMNQQQRELKRREFRERVDSQVAALQEKKAAGTLTPPEERRLARMQTMSQKLKEDRPARNRTNAPAPSAKGEVESLPVPRLQN